MVILINDVAVRKDSGGVFTILNDLFNAALNDKKNSYIFIIADDFFQSKENVKVVVRNDLQSSYLKRMMFDFGFGSKFIRTFNPDVIVSMQNTAMLKLSDIKQFVYLHQPLPFQREMKFSLFKKNERKLLFYQVVVGSVIKLTMKLAKNTSIIVQSNWLKSELIKRSLKKDDQIIVSKPKENKLSLVSIPNNNERYSFFFPSTAMLYKNHKLIVDALNYISYEDRKKLEIIFTLSNEEYKNLVGDEKPSEVHLLGRISRSEVMNNFKKSTLLFPSLIETYGLPIIEAKALKRPLIVADVPVLKETVDAYDNVQYFNPFNAKQLAMCIEKTITNRNTVSELSEEVVNDSESLNELIQIFSERVKL